VAAGVCDAAGIANGFLVVVRQLGEAIGEAGIRAEGGGSIQHLAGIAAKRLEKRAGSFVRQAEDGDVRPPGKRGLRVDILAVGFGQI